MYDLDVKKHSGSYYTKSEIVSLILDLVGYNIEKNLFKLSILEPSAGQGAFMIQIVERLIASFKNNSTPYFMNNDDAVFEILKSAVCSIEKQHEKHIFLKNEVMMMLTANGFSLDLAQRLVNEWFINVDFLLWNTYRERTFDFIVGNPPYIRIENIPYNESKEYRSLYTTLYDRADIYVAFIEHSLEILSSGGRLSFICTDRFAKNKYGQKIRSLINNHYRVVNYLDIHNSQPFYDEVSAYPCIFTIENGPQKEVKTLKMDELSEKNITEAKNYLLKEKNIVNNELFTHTISDWFKNEEPWILNGQRASDILAKLEKIHPLLTDDPHNITVGIGVATGANDIYIVRPDEVDIEPDVLIPTVTKDDIKQGIINWQGKYLINPYCQDGSLIDLNNYPKLKLYFEIHEAHLRKRSTAKNNPNKWFKTIDRIYPHRIKLKKLLIPDIKSKNLIVLDEGNFYPEHSLYYITEGNWDIYALQALLSSSIIKFFIWSYATKMRGDYLRYQAQYLKKIRLPINVSSKENEQLIELFKNNDYSGIDLIARKLYNLTVEELSDIQDLVM